MERTFAFIEPSPWGLIMTHFWGKLLSDISYFAGARGQWIFFFLMGILRLSASYQSCLYLRFRFHEN